MDKMHTSTAVLDLPPMAGRSALRAGLSLMKLRIVSASHDWGELAATLGRLGDLPEVVAFVDISHVIGARSSRLLELDAAIALDENRRRVFLTRLADGHVCEADRRWVRSLGFADLLPEFDRHDPDGELRRALDAVAHALGLFPPAAADLVGQLRLLGDDHTNVAPRAAIRALCGQSAEALAALMQRSLVIEDRSYHLHIYPQCFIGTQAVAWMTQQFGCSSEHAVTLGQALSALGLLEHVVQEHPFLDGNYFYRLALSEAADALDLGEVYSRLRADGLLPHPDLTYLGEGFRGCWVGSQAVDRLCEQYGLARHQSTLVLQRLMRFGLIEHVRHARGFTDATTFYRFTDEPIHEK